MGCEEGDLGLSDGKEPGKGNVNGNRKMQGKKRGRPIRMQGKKRVQPWSLGA